MGLDMYLNRTKKIDGFQAGTYMELSDILPSKLTKYEARNFDFEAKTGIKNANELQTSIYRHGDLNSFYFYCAYEEVGYWRKANAIHKWFVDNVQNGVDECNSYFVTKERLVELLSIVNAVLCGANPGELLPTKSGFFFGGTDYDEWYYMKLKYTKKTLKKVIKETDFDNQVIIYESSW